MKEDIIQLRALQAIDLRIGRLEDEMVAEKAELEKRKSKTEEYKAAIAKLEEKMAANETRRRELEAELDDELARIKDRQTKLMNVQTNREYQSLLKETEEAKKANKRREEEIVLLMGQHETYKNSIEEQTNLCKGEEKLLAEDEKKVAKHAADLSKQKDSIAKERAAKVKEVPESLLKKYDMLREKRNGIAVVGVNNGVCHGCYMNIPPQLYNELLKDDKLLSCPTCHRIMYIQLEEEVA